MSVPLDEETVRHELDMVLWACATGPPAPPEVIRTMLARARDAGLDWRRLYRDAAASVPRSHPPAPPIEAVAPE